MRKTIGPHYRRRQRGFLPGLQADSPTDGPLDFCRVSSCGPRFSCRPRVRWLLGCRGAAGWRDRAGGVVGDSRAAGWLLGLPTSHGGAQDVASARCCSSMASRSAIRSNSSCMMKTASDTHPRVAPSRSELTEVAGAAAETAVTAAAAMRPRHDEYGLQPPSGHRGVWPVGRRRNLGGGRQGALGRRLDDVRVPLHSVR